MRTVTGLGILGVAALLFAAVSVRPPAFSVMIVTLDTTRADRLTSYGLMDTEMPSFDRIASDGTVFDQAISVSPLTLPAHATIFTGLLPPRHGVRDNVDRPLDSSHTTLAEVLHGQGFRTAGFVASIVLDAGRGLHQGFDTYSGVSPRNNDASHRLQKRADAVVDAAVAWLQTLKEDRFFLWAHLYDAHRPYDPPAPYATGDPYTGEIAYAASQFDRLLEALRASNRLDSTIIIVAGDHGESLGEHGEVDHGIFLYEGVIRVPLMIRVPGLRSQRVGEVVRLTDIMPTVLDLLGVAPVSTDGVSLAPLVKGERAGLDLEAYSESLYPQRFGWSSIYALRDSRFKFIDAPRPELYDLSVDPFESRNIIGDRPALASEMQRRVRQIASSGPDVRGAVVDSTLTEDVRKRLAALGYTSGGTVRPESATGDLPDAKDCIGRLAAGHTRTPCPARPPLQRD